MGSFTTLMLGQQLKLLKGGREEARPHGNRLYIQVALSINETWVGGVSVSQSQQKQTQGRTCRAFEDVWVQNPKARV